MLQTQFIARNLDQNNLLCIAKEERYAGNKIELLMDSLVQNVIIANQEKSTEGSGKYQGACGHSLCHPSKDMGKMNF